MGSVTAPYACYIHLNKVCVPFFVQISKVEWYYISKTVFLFNVLKYVNTLSESILILAFSLNVPQETPSMNIYIYIF